MNRKFQLQALELLMRIEPGLVCEVGDVTEESLEFLISSERRTSCGWIPQAHVIARVSGVSLQLASDSTGTPIPYPIGIRDAHMVSRVLAEATRLAQILEFRLQGT